MRKSSREQKQPTRQSRIEKSGGECLALLNGLAVFVTTAVAERQKSAARIGTGGLL